MTTNNDTQGFPVALTDKSRNFIDSTNGLPVALAAGQTLLSMGVPTAPTAATFSRPADTTAYAAGDLVANSTTAGSVNAASFTGFTISGDGGSGVIDSVAISKSGTATCTLRAHFFRTTTPTVSAGDNAAIAVSNFDADKYIGYVDVNVIDLANGGALGVTANVGLSYVIPAGDALYCLLEAVAAFTPTSGGTFTVKPRLRRFS